MSVCEPWWLHTKEECPYGTLLLGDITLPNHLDVFAVAAIIYSYVPFAVAGVFILRFLWYRGTQELFFLTFSGLIVFCNEVIFKKLVAGYRPGQQFESGEGKTPPNVGTCALSCGMPSSHASIATGFYLLILFEYFSYVGTAKVSHKDFAIFFLCWTCVLLPVPYARLILHDHSTTQVVCGGGLGLCLAVAWIMCLQVVQRRWAHKIGNTIYCGGVPLLRHTLPPPLESILGGNADACPLVAAPPLASDRLSQCTLLEPDPDALALIVARGLQA
eukprot:GEMP01066111.1.p1 GENE.GEMP01066111.1~~GEMP01066111.1.p1  ORF type:complete len:282 (+),score=51.29 GEMP01066111.1:27-848(+)